MITTIPRNELMTTGSRLRGGYLIEQAGYTLGVAAAEGPALASLLPKDYQSAVKAASADVERALKDRRNADAEAKDATRGQNQSVRAAKVWMRKASRRALLARRLGQAIPDGLVKLSAPLKVTQLFDQLSTMVKLLETNSGKLVGTDLAALVSEGKALAKTLAAADADQEIKRLKAMPEAVRNFYYQKGLLYIGLKAINDAGNALYAGDRAAAAKFNLSILHRRAGKRKVHPEISSVQAATK